MAYATLEDLAEFLGVPVLELPPNARRDLDYSIDVIEAYSFGRITEAKFDAARRAVMAQYEFQASLAGMEHLGDITSVSMGSSFSASFDGAMPQIAKRARTILFTNGLMYRGVRSR